MTASALNTKISEIKNKILDHSSHYTTPEFNKLTEENFTARLKQTDLVSKTVFDDKLTSLNWNITSNKIKYIELQKKLNSPITKGYNFFLGRIYFTGNYRSQNTFAFQSTLDTLELKKEKGIGYVLSWKSRRVFNFKLMPLYTAFLHSITISGFKMTHEIMRRTHIWLLNIF